jgi:signal transduction histidine kinase
MKAVSESGQGRLLRDPRGAILGGVCSGIARRYGFDPILLRIGLVVATIASGGVAAIAYLIAWGVMPAGTSRAERRPRALGRRGSWRIATGVALMALGLLLAFRELGLWWSDALVWPLTLASFGVALLWSLTRPERDPDEEAEEAIVLQTEPRERALRISRAGFGISLVVAAALLVLWGKGIFEGAGDAALAALVVIVAVALISAPLWWGLLRRLSAERAARIRSQERAELAAHLHDSVLQTLAVMQRRADDPAAVAKLARRQERELRGWLAGGTAARPTERLADALRTAAAEVEETHGAFVDAVVVGDAPLDERFEALVAASREALTNAAKFAGEGGPVRLYAEIENGGASVWVDDRGPGFDPERIPGDRRGLRESIIGRMGRHGGTAEVRSAPGSGTEVELRMEAAR